MNTLSKRNMFTLIMLLLMLPLLKEVNGFPSGGSLPPTFTKGGDGHYYDSWGFDRNSDGGPYGYAPNIAYETLGNNKELAYSIGESFKANFESRVRRAEEILKYVQRWTEYGYDKDNVVIDGAAQNEWAWNADEMAHKFDTTRNIVATGDCEDLAFLCATIYLGAGIDAAIVLVPGHCALVIWLPEYPNANHYWDINDGRGKGWIWVEATGENNALGWTPPDYSGGNWEAIYPLGSEGGFGFSSFPWEGVVIVSIIVGVFLLAIIVKRTSTSHAPKPLPPPPPPPSM
jgi:hypothetical protein